MGSCYYVEYELYFKDKEKATQQLGLFLENNLNDFKMSQDITLESMIELVLLKNNEHAEFTKNGCKYSSSFDASYSWEAILSGVIYAIANCLCDGSQAYIEPDDYFYKIFIENGSIVDTREADVVWLKGKDVRKVKTLDEESGFNVGQWLEDLKDTEVAENCFGLFYNKDLIGYCTLGYAQGVINLEDVEAEDWLLSDVYVKPQYRHKMFGSQFLKEVLYKTEGVCYLTYLSDKLEGFYENLGFYKVDGTDNIMKRED